MKINLQVDRPAQRPRVHYVLFQEGTPFKPKRVNLKNRYKRNEKHRNKSSLDN